jgi:hypothetical protein
MEAKDEEVRELKRQIALLRAQLKQMTGQSPESWEADGPELLLSEDSPEYSTWGAPLSLATSVPDTSYYSEVVDDVWFSHRQGT